MNRTHQRIAFVMVGLVFAGMAFARVHSSDYFEPGPQRLLAEAGERGNLKEIDRLLAAGADVNALGRERMTALVWSLLHLNKKGFEYLLQKGANPNITMEESRLTSDGVTDGSCAVSLSARMKDPWYLSTVLKYGGDPNVINPIRKTTPIFNCIALSDRRRPEEAKARVSQVKMLIAAKAHLDTRDKDGYSVLFLAHVAIRYDIIYELLQAGADPKAPITPRGTTLIDFIPKARIDPASELFQWRAKVISLLRSRGIEVPDPEIGAK